MRNSHFGTKLNTTVRTAVDKVVKSSQISRSIGWVTFAHVHIDDNTQIIICRHQRGHHTNQGKAGISTLNDCAEEIELADQSESGREADE